jgi:hypothetical protein
VTCARGAQLEYLRAVLLKYFELGPASFDELFPLLVAFLEFSPDEQRRMRDAHVAHLGGLSDQLPANLWGLLGGASAAQPAPSAALPLPPFPTPPVALASPTAAPITPAPAPRTPASVAATDDDHAPTADAAKLARMKKLLAAADKRLAQVHATIQERDARILRLEDHAASAR